MTLNNPETIEIHGLKTIHKLCKFGADNNMEGCTFTEILERMFIELEKPALRRRQNTSMKFNLGLLFNQHKQWNWMEKNLLLVQMNLQSLLSN